MRLFAGDPGVDPYTRVVSDLYQDLFGEGSFVGKGIYDVDAFEQSCGAFPENTILSHDLLEGAYARSALLSDVELYEDFPSRYLTDVSRRRRWIRGDWQIAWWLLPRVSGRARTGKRTRSPCCRGGRSSTTSAAAWCRCAAACSWCWPRGGRAVTAHDSRLLAVVGAVPLLAELVNRVPAPAGRPYVGGPPARDEQRAGQTPGPDPWSRSSSSPTRRTSASMRFCSRWCGSSDANTNFWNGRPPATPRGARAGLPGFFRAMWIGAGACGRAGVRSEPFGPTG